MKRETVTHAAFMELPQSTLDFFLPYVRPDQKSDKVFRVNVVKPWMLEIWEPLSTKVPDPNLAIAYCCYLNTVIWYVRPYTVRPFCHLWSSERPSTHIPRVGFVWHAEKPGSHFEEWARVDYHLTWDVRFTYNGTEFQTGGGGVEWLGDNFGRRTGAEHQRYVRAVNIGIQQTDLVAELCESNSQIDRNRSLPYSAFARTDVEIALSYYASEDSAGCGIDRQPAIDALRELQGYKLRVEARRKAKCQKAVSEAVLSEHNGISAEVQA